MDQLFSIFAEFFGKLRTVLNENANESNSQLSNLNDGKKSVRKKEPTKDKSKQTPLNFASINNNQVSKNNKASIQHQQAIPTNDAESSNKKKVRSKQTVLMNPVVADKTKAIKKQKDKNAPKKPLSAFMLYNNFRRPQVKKENPQLTLPETSKVIGEEWNKLSESQKKIWQERARKAKLNYELLQYQQVSRQEKSIKYRTEADYSDNETTAKSQSTIVPHSDHASNHKPKPSASLGKPHTQNLLSQRATLDKQSQDIAKRQNDLKKQLPFLETQPKIKKQPDLNSGSGSSSLEDSGESSQLSAVNNNKQVEMIKQQQASSKVPIKKQFPDSD
eukprot:403367152